MPVMSDPTYRRGQLEWALWRFFSRGRIEGAPPAVFRTRVKRLLEPDRSVGDGGVDPAFHDAAPVGLGGETAYSAFNVFTLTVGLDLLDIGFKQSEVVFLLQSLRSDLETVYRNILWAPPSPRQLIAAEDLPGAPAYERNGVRIADARVFMVISKVDLKETVSGADADTPFIHRPRFFRGIEALRGELHEMGYDNRKQLVLELAEMAVIIKTNLEKAPLIKRGRRSEPGKAGRA